MSDQECCSVNLSPVKGALRSAKAIIAHKGRKVTLEESDRRMSICLSCEHLIPKTRQCDVCKCFMNLKTRFEGMECPINKW